MDRFQQDVQIVLTQLRPSAEDPALLGSNKNILHDFCLASFFHVFPSQRRNSTVPSSAPFRHRRLSFTNLWNLEMWKDHSSRWRFVRDVYRFPISRLLRRVTPQLLALLGWTCLVHWMIPLLKSTSAASATTTSATSPSTLPLSLISTFVAALLTLRSNQGLSRLSEGRLAWGRCALLTRDTAQLLTTVLQPPSMATKTTTTTALLDEAQPKHVATTSEKNFEAFDDEVSLSYLLLAARHLSLYGFLLKSRLGEEDAQDLVRAMLPNKEDQDYVLASSNQPAAALLRIRQVITTAYSSRLPDKWSLSEQSALQNNLTELNRVTGMCDRIKSTPIPPLYSSHTTRLLMLYLASLPWVLLWKATAASWWWSLVTMASVGYTMLGLDEISHLLEQPFRLMPTYQLSKNVMKNVVEVVSRPLPTLPY